MAKSELKLRMKPNTIQHIALQTSMPGTALHELYQKKILEDKSSLQDLSFGQMKELMMVNKQTNQSSELGHNLNNPFFLKAEDDIMSFESAANFIADQEDFLILDLVDQLNSHQAFGFPKGSEFRAIFDFQITKMKESGQIDLLRQKWLFSKPKTKLGSSTMSQLSQATTLGFENAVFSFGILALGVFMAFVVAPIERLSRLRMK